MYDPLMHVHSFRPMAEVDLEEWEVKDPYSGPLAAGSREARWTWRSILENRRAVLAVRAGNYSLYSIEDDGAPRLRDDRGCGSRGP